MLPTAQLNLLPLTQLMLLKQAVDLAAEKWEPDIEKYGYEKEFLLEGTIQGTPTKP